MARTDARRIAGLAVAVLATGALAAALYLAPHGSAGPVEVPLDRVACARCGMLVSEIGFAGQLRTRSGEVRFYDDPGCLLLDAEEHADDPSAVWFHAHDAERWLSAAEVGFERTEPTPMGYGLAARAAGEGRLDRAAALAHARAREAARLSERP